MPVKNQRRESKLTGITADIMKTNQQLKNIRNWINSMPTEDFASVVERADKVEEAQVILPQFFEFLLECVRLNTISAFGAVTAVINKGRKPNVKPKKPAAKKRVK